MDITEQGRGHEIYTVVDQTTRSLEALNKLRSIISSPDLDAKLFDLVIIEIEKQHDGQIIAPEGWCLAVSEKSIGEDFHVERMVDTSIGPAWERVPPNLYSVTEGFESRHPEFVPHFAARWLEHEPEEHELYAYSGSGAVRVLCNARTNIEPMLIRDGLVTE